MMRIDKIDQRLRYISDRHTQDIMNQPPQIFDRPALAQRRARAQALGRDGFFLHDIAQDEIHERLKDVNRSFTNPALITGFPEVWRGFMDAELIADADALQFSVPGKYDLILHVFGLHAHNDPLGQIIQSARALAPDGLFLAVCFGGETLNELRTSLAEAEVEISGGLSPRVSPMAEIRDLGALLQRAGLALPVVDNVLLPVEYRNLAHLMGDLRAMGEANALAQRQRRPSLRTLFDRAGEIYAHHFGTEKGKIRASFDLHFLSGWAPHESQQKPLKPGSATHALGDFLNLPKESQD